MKTNKKSLTTLAVSMAMAALVLLPLHMNAQYDENRFGLQEWGQTSLLGKQGTGGTRDGESFDITNGNFGETDPAPLGSGIAILIGAGLGYAAFKKKEDKQ